MYLLKFFYILIIISLSGCFQSTNSNGLSLKAISDIDIEIGKTSRKNLIMKYGPPTFESVFNKNVIYYISHQYEYKNLSKSQTTNLLVYEIVLNKNNYVEKFKKYNKDNALEIEIAEDIKGENDNLRLFFKNIISNLQKRNIDN